MSLQAVLGLWQMVSLTYSAVIKSLTLAKGRKAELRGDELEYNLSTLEGMWHLFLSWINCLIIRDIWFIDLEIVPLGIHSSLHGAMHIIKAFLYLLISEF